MLQSFKDGKGSVVTSTTSGPSPGAKMQIEKTSPHLMRPRLTMVADGVHNVTAYHLSTPVVGNWSETAIAMPKILNIGQCFGLVEVLRFMAADGNIVNMSKLYINAEKMQKAKTAVPLRSD